MHRPDYRIPVAAAVLACICLAAMPASAALIDLTPDAGAVNSDDAVSLADLLSGEVMGLQVGDKVFTGFSYSTVGDMPDASNVNVLGYRDDQGNWGVSFHGAFQDLPGGAASDALIRFMVEVEEEAAAQGYRISDAHLAIAGAGVGGDDSYFIVDETLSNGETLSAYVTTLGEGQDSQLTDDVVFPLVTKLTVTKDILAVASEGSNLPARATVIDQSFSQEVIPEPVSLLLMGISSLAFVGITRRRG